MPSAHESVDTVILVDDDAAVRKALTRQITGFGYAVRAFGSAREYLDQAQAIRGDCLIVDLVMPEIDGLALLEALHRTGHGIPAFLLSAQGDIPSTVSAMRSGALDFLEKPVEADVLQAAIARAMAYGESQRLRAAAFDAARQRLALLTVRQRQVLREVVTGAPNKVIAHRLGISLRTVKAHRQQVMEKLDARSVVDLTLLAADLGLTAENPSAAPGAEADVRAEG